MAELIYKMKELKSENENLRGGKLEDIEKIKNENKRLKMELIKLKRESQAGKRPSQEGYDIDRNFMSDDLSNYTLDKK